MTPPPKAPVWQAWTGAFRPCTLRGLGLRDFEALRDAELLELLLATAGWLYSETGDPAGWQCRP
jgi:hypothetical protein